MVYMSVLKDKIEKLLAPAGLKYEKTDYRFSISETIILFGLALIIFSIPFNHINAIKSAGIIMALFGWLSYKAIRREWKIRYNPLFFPIAVFLAAVLISLFTCYDFHYTLKRIRGEILTLILLFIIITDYCTHKDKIYIIFYFFLGGNILALILFLVQFYYNDFSIIKFTFSIARKEFMSKGLPHTSIYFLLSTTFIYIAFYYVKRLKWFLALIPYFLVNMFLLLVSNQRAALVGMVCVFLAHFILLKEHRRKSFVVILIIFGVSTAFVLFTPLKTIIVHEDWSKIIKMDLSSESKYDSFQLRVKIQRYFWNYLKKNPFNGVGYGRKNLKKVEKELTIKKPADLSHAHNMFFNFALQTGVQGLLALLYLIIVQFKISWTGLKESKNNLDRFLFAGTSFFMIGIWTRLQLDDVFRYGTALSYWIIIAMATSLGFTVRRDGKTRDWKTG